MNWTRVGLAIALAACGKADAPAPEPAPVRDVTPPPEPAPIMPAPTPAQVAPAPGPFVPPKVVDPGDASTWKQIEYDDFTIVAWTRAPAEGVMGQGNQYVFGDITEGAGLLVQVTFVPFAVEDVDAFLAQAVDGTIPARATVTVQRQVTVAGVDGLDVTWRGKIAGIGNVVGRTRAFFRRRLYQVQAIYPAGKKGRPDLANRFIESFALTPDAP